MLVPVGPPRRPCASNPQCAVQVFDFVKLCEWTLQLGAGKGYLDLRFMSCQWTMPQASNRILPFRASRIHEYQQRSFLHIVLPSFKTEEAYHDFTCDKNLGLGGPVIPYTTGSI